MLHRKRTSHDHENGPLSEYFSHSSLVEKIEAKLNLQKDLSKSFRSSQSCSLTEQSSPQKNIPTKSKISPNKNTTSNEVHSFDESQMIVCDTRKSVQSKELLLQLEKLEVSYQEKYKLISRQLDDSAQEVIKLQSENTALIKENNELKDQIKQLERDFDSKIQATFSESQKKKQLENEKLHTTYQKSIGELEQKCKESLILKSRFEQENEKLKDQLKQIKLEVDLISREKDNIEKNYHSIMTANNQLLKSDIRKNEKSLMTVLNNTSFQNQSPIKDTKTEREIKLEEMLGHSRNEINLMQMDYKKMEDKMNGVISKLAGELRRYKTTNKDQNNFTFSHRETSGEPKKHNEKKGNYAVLDQRPYYTVSHAINDEYYSEKSTLSKFEKDLAEIKSILRNNLVQNNFKQGSEYYK